MYAFLKYLIYVKNNIVYNTVLFLGKHFHGTDTEVNLFQITLVGCACNQY